MFTLTYGHNGGGSSSRSAIFSKICLKYALLVTVLGRQANLKESSESKELAELRLQVLVVVMTSDACESNKEIMRLKSDL